MSQYRIAIVATRQRFYIDTMDAQIGMETSCGPIVRFTAKQVVTRGERGDAYHGGHLPNASITITEAKRWGWKPSAEQETQIAQRMKEYR